MSNEEERNAVVMGTLTGWRDRGIAPNQAKALVSYGIYDIGRRENIDREALERRVEDAFDLVDSIWSTRQ